MTTATQIRTGPEDYTWGLGEVIRGYRLYLGLSRPAMAHHIGIATRSYERMEDGHNACPPGFIDTLRGIAARFDEDVDTVTSECVDDPHVQIGEDNEYRRAVMGRAAVACARITPVLD